MSAVYSHVTIGSANIPRAARFYDAVLKPLGMVRRKISKAGTCYAPKDFDGVNEPFWVVLPLDGQAASAGNGVTVAFDARSRAAVDEFYAAPLAAGGIDAGAPGLRTLYHPHYYGAYVRDLDGNKICAVCHRPE